ncbi:MAG: uncharacterized protein QG657_2461 [Acidobacteriota bacterium]|nr:uncharacterized protein [Acidobacteriota bacterium]
MKDPTKTIKYYDPIYEIITIKPYEKDWGRGRKFWLPAMDAKNEHLVENIIARVLKSLEMSRLNFLRQSGLAFLVFPSSTHTRFAHSLGTYHLGLEALNRSWIKAPEHGDKLISLEKWIEPLGLKEEFLLALLLHDVGHFPFSHVLENNHSLPFKLESHEEIAVDYILGGKYSEAFQEYLGAEYGLRERKRLSCIIDELNSKLKDPIDKEVISFLICKDHNYITKREYDLNKIKMLAEFTSGLLDLDRFDHYRRDSFFMGTNLARFNVSSFLDDVILTADGIELKGDGISHAISLLQSQDNIRTYNFENEENLAYEAMLNYCVSEYFIELKNLNQSEFEWQKKEIVFWTDEELLRYLGTSKRPDVKHLLFKMKFQEPYSLLGKYSGTNVSINSVERVLSLQKKILKQLPKKVKPEQLLFRMPRKYGKDINPEGEWLSLSRLRDEKGESLSKSGGPMENEVNYIRRKLDAHQNCLWVFCDGLNEDQKKRIDDIITGRKFN